MVERTAQDWCSGIVYDQRHAKFSANRGYLGDGEYLEFRVGQGFCEIASRLVIGCGPERLRVRRVDEAAFDPHRAERILQQVPGSTIEISGADNIVAGMGNVGDRQKSSGLT